ncbi:hypothetical protein HC752_18730 [Vibrio sp. S9_S30]|uniref:tetratricopeptide repeat protein n=1 Tax=Vibrio sp. S9_S30 TaxID=2720226 RepID=UPI00168023E7|nr:hypothetical protein [Vibrio sp. S9_S30]MBD1558975.1 hypothetical protein [Vibrio sp. S9_S30]
MSVINKALSEMSANKSSSGRIERVEVSPLKKRSQAMWIVMLVVISVAGGAWLMLGQPTSDSESVQISDSVPVSENVKPNRSSNAAKPVTTVVMMEATPPTQQTVSESVTNIYSDQVTKDDEASPSFVASSVSDGVHVTNVESEKSRAAPQSSPTSIEEPVQVEKSPVIKKTEAPTLQAAKETKPKTQALASQKEGKTEKANVISEKASQVPVAKTSSVAEIDQYELRQQPITNGEMSIQQVELTPKQLADKALSRAKKSLDANDFDGAIKGYQTALRYVPKDDVVRKKLAALYYGRGNVRQSLEILQKGIVLDRDNQVLRLAAMNILVKEGINEAALGVLEHLPPRPEQDYLAARAGLAQQLKNYPIALESYQMLVQQDQENGKWWLGLGIQQERSAQYSQAKVSYQKALNRVGLSVQTNRFIRERIAYINDREASSNAD